MLQSPVDDQVPFLPPKLGWTPTGEERVAENGFRVMTLEVLGECRKLKREAEHVECQEAKEIAVRQVRWRQEIRDVEMESIQLHVRREGLEIVVRLE